MPPTRIVLSTLLGVLLLVPPAFAQESRRTMSAIVMAAPAAPEHHVVRLNGAIRKGEQSVSGYIDFFGDDTSRRYGELYVRRDFRRAGGFQLELNEGSNGTGILRGGLIFDVPVPRGAYLNVKILPAALAVKSDVGMLQAGKLGMFGGVAKGQVHLENWTIYSVRDGRRPALLTEFSVWRTLRGRLAASAQAAYDAHSPGWVYRAGVRTVLF